MQFRKKDTEQKDILANFNYMFFSLFNFFIRNVMIDVLLEIYWCLLESKWSRGEIIDTLIEKYFSGEGPKYSFLDNKANQILEMDRSTSGV